MNEEGVAFSSSWDIDQIAIEGETSLTFPAGTSSQTVVSLPADYAVIGAPVVEAVFKIGAGRWRQFGETFFLKNSSSSVWVEGTGTATLTVRYYVYTDKVAH
jgi:hypothetical protein